MAGVDIPTVQVLIGHKTMGHDDAVHIWRQGTSGQRSPSRWNWWRKAHPMATTGRLEAIWLKRMRRGPMDAVERAMLKAQQGIVGNTDQGGRRQVTLLEREVWQALMAQVGATLSPSVRRANVLLSGIRLVKSRKRILGIRVCRIRLLGETKPCERMEKACPGLQRRCMLIGLVGHWAKYSTMGKLS